MEAWGWQPLPPRVIVDYAIPVCSGKETDFNHTKKGRRLLRSTSQTRSLKKDNVASRQGCVFRVAPTPLSLQLIVSSRRATRQPNVAPVVEFVGWYVVDRLYQCTLTRRQAGFPSGIYLVYNVLLFGDEFFGREGDLFGDEFFAVAVKDVLGTPFRTATAVTRTAPSELLVIPSR